MGSEAAPQMVNPAPGALRRRTGYPCEATYGSALRLATVADRRACRVDAAGKCGVRDRAAAPDGVEQLVAANYAIADADEQFQKVEYLRLDGDMILRTAQLASVGVEHEVTEIIEKIVNHTGICWMN
jgi:hypothetical protein